MNNLKKYFFSLAFFLFAFYNQTFAYVCPDYFFSIDLAKGQSHEDVKVIQEILNLDKRTIVAYSGPGSKGNETGYFGVATREALKRFQALFIEYIGVANGQFGPKTRTTMNAVCKGPFFTGEEKNVFDVGSTTPKDTTPPIVAVAGPYSADITQVFRAYVGSNEAIKTPTLDGLIIFNATAADIRKVSSTSYSFAVTPNQDARGDITLQFEADVISDLAGNKNENATNEWVVKIVGPTKGATTPQVEVPEFVIPEIDLPTITPSPTDCINVASVKVSDYSNPCYGKVPTDFGSQTPTDSGGGGGGGSGIAQMLQGLLQGLMSALGGAGGGGGDLNGKNVADAGCGCVGGQTTLFTPIGAGGPPGRHLLMGVVGSGEFVTGKFGPPPPICGVRPRSGPQDPCAGINGTHTANCCGINFDVTNSVPVTATQIAPTHRSN